MVCLEFVKFMYQITKDWTRQERQCLGQTSEDLVALRLNPGGNGERAWRLYVRRIIGFPPRFNLKRLGETLAIIGAFVLVGSLLVLVIITLGLISLIEKKQKTCF